MVADGSVGSRSELFGFPIVCLGSVSFLACCGISHVVFVWTVCGRDLDMVLHTRRLLKKFIDL